MDCEYDDSVRVLGTNLFVVLNLEQMQMSIGSNSWIAEYDDSVRVLGTNLFVILIC